MEIIVVPIYAVVAWAVAAAFTLGFYAVFKWMQRLQLRFLRLPKELNRWEARAVGLYGCAILAAFLTGQSHAEFGLCQILAALFVLYLPLRFSLIPLLLKKRRGLNKAK